MTVPHSAFSSTVSNERLPVYACCVTSPVSEQVAELAGQGQIESHACGSFEYVLRDYRVDRPGLIVAPAEPSRPCVAKMLDALRRRNAFPTCLLYADGSSVAWAVELLKKGAYDVFELPCSDTMIRHRIERAVAQEWSMEAERRRRQSLRKKFASLTAGEYDVLERMAVESSNQEIADRLGVCLRTVHARRSRILEKLEVTSRPEVLRMWVEYKGLEAEPPAGQSTVANVRLEEIPLN